MIINASAPVRIDLAGGAFDVHPLYLFEGGGPTVNIAIDIRTKVRLETRDDSEIHLRSLDLQVTETAPNVDLLDLDGELGFVARIVRFYRPDTGLNVTTEVDFPKGSGLGTSSSLLIALSGGLNELNQSGYSQQQIIDYGANIESESLRVPTGKQDYFAAMYGGINVVWSYIKGSWTEPVELSEAKIAELNECMVLSFAGEPRFSGALTWMLVRGYVDDTGNTRQVSRDLKASGMNMRNCLLAGADSTEFVRLLREEWEIRKETAEGVTNPQIEKTMGDTEQAGALANKLCGAGGGGCMITFVEPQNRAAVIEALQANGARHMPFEIAREGLRITSE